MGLLQLSLAGRCCLGPYLVRGRFYPHIVTRVLALSKTVQCPPHTGLSLTSRGLKKGEADGEMVKNTLVGGDFHNCGALKALSL